jgi:hypothetical protein
VGVGLGAGVGVEDGITGLDVGDGVRVSAGCGSGLRVAGRVGAAGVQPLNENAVRKTSQRTFLEKWWFIILPRGKSHGIRFLGMFVWRTQSHK